MHNTHNQHCAGSGDAVALLALALTFAISPTAAQQSAQNLVDELGGAP
jgi:hypothetical protein